MLNIKKKIMMAATTTALGAMLIGAGTFALFTSTASNAGNSFTAGTVAISLSGNDTVNSKYFEVSNIAPGDSAGKQITVKNDGSLDLRYNLTKTLTGDLASGTNPLYLNVYGDDGSDITFPRTLAPGASESYWVSYTLPKAAGNEYQGKSATLGLTVDAVQTKNN